MTLVQLAIVATPVAIVFHSWRTEKMSMTRIAFLASISTSLSGLAGSLSTIAGNLTSHPCTGDSDFDPDGKLAAAADQLTQLAASANTIADQVNPRTPGGVTDTTEVNDGSTLGGDSAPATTTTTGGDAVPGSTVQTVDNGGDSGGEVDPQRGANPEPATDAGATVANTNPADVPAGAANADESQQAAPETHTAEQPQDGSTLTGDAFANPVGNNTDPAA